MKKLLEILNLIKKRVKNQPEALPFDHHSAELSIYEKLKEGYQILLESTPEAILFEEYVKNESADLLENALIEFQSEKQVEIAKPTYTEVGLRQVFRLFLPTNAISPLMTWQMR